jgi:hypothetical protein
VHLNKKATDPKIRESHRLRAVAFGFERDKITHKVS